MRTVHPDALVEGRPVSAQTFEIPGRFLGRNEAERLARSHWSKASEVKREETETVMLYARKAGIKPVMKPVEVSIVFSEEVKFYKNGKRKKIRDVDNVMGACKPILDGLVKANVLPDDNPDWVRRVIPVVKYVRNGPHITVTIMEYEPFRRVVYPPVNVPESDCEK